jgi:hypothetical protein
MASRFDVEDLRDSAERRDSADKDDDDDDDNDADPDFSLLRQGRNSNPATVSAIHRIQQRLHRVIGILCIVLIVVAIAAMLVVFVREILEFFAYDDKDGGWGTRGMGYRDFPLFLISLTVIVFAVLNRTRLRVRLEPLPPSVNSAVQAGLLLAQCAIVGLGMVPWPSDLYDECRKKLASLEPSMPNYDFYVKYCGRTILYGRVRMLDMVVADSLAVGNMIMLIVSLVLLYCSKRLDGEGLTAADVMATIRRLKTSASESWADARQWWSERSWRRMPSANRL